MVKSCYKEDAKECGENEEFIKCIILEVVINITREEGIKKLVVRVNILVKRMDYLCFLVYKGYLYYIEGKIVLRQHDPVTQVLLTFV